jgi:hypothetical protein
VALVLVLALAALVWFTVFTAFTTTARAGSPPSSPTTESTVTTESPTTSEAPTTVTTARPSTTSTSAAPRSTTTPTTSRSSTTTTEAAPESIAPTTESSEPEIVTDDTLPRRADTSSDSGLSTDAKLAMVVGGLVAVGVLIGVLTFLYWRHTRPQQYLTALDALADVEQKVPKDGEKIPTGENKTVPAGVGAAAGAVGAAGAAETSQTQAFRIIDPSPASSDTSTPPLGTPKVESPPSLDEPTTITTIEDLQQTPPKDGDGGR